MLAFVFPGQGSQAKGMGAELFDSVSEFTELEEEINTQLGYSVKRVCLENPGNVLKNTEYTQPCLYTVNALHFYRNRAEGIEPQMVAGHSLGEYNALHAAGAFDFMTGLRLVQKRGELMARARSGAMSAVIGLPPESITQVIASEGFKGVDIANYNSPNQIVVSGVAEEVARLTPALEEGGGRVVPLPVSAAFHSRLMTDAADNFEAFLGDFAFSPLTLPVISNVTATPYTPGDPSSVIRWGLHSQICGAVNWADSIRFMRQQGIEEFIEAGPGSVLTGLIKAIP